MHSEELVKLICDGGFDERLLDLYEDEAKLAYQRERYVKAIRFFEEKFGAGDVTLLSVPGRSEVGGNHTDHQHGCVLACGINLDIIAVARRSDKMTVYSNGTSIGRIDINNLSLRDSEKRTSLALVKGVLRKLSLQGHKIGPVEAVMYSDVLVGSGLSSSAAFEVSIANMMSHFYNNGEISPLDMAIASQYAENVYFGKPCGLMDQSACAFGGLIFIDFKNIREPFVRKLDVDFGSFGYSLCIVDTKGSHSGLTDDYAAIPEEMLSVAGFFGKEVLRDVSYDQIIANVKDLRKVCGDRAVLRALHFAEENERPAKEAEALEKGDFECFKQLLAESGNSSYKYLQNVYTNHNIREQAVSLGINLSEHLLKGGKGVCRVHGGGFAGTIQAFVRNEYVDKYKKGIEQLCGENTCLILKVNKYGACKLIG